MKCPLLRRCYLTTVRFISIRGFILPFSQALAADSSRQMCIRDSCWCEGLALLLHLNPWLKWDVQGLEGLNKKNWYLLISNHHSWADIVVPVSYTHLDVYKRQALSGVALEITMQYAVTLRDR